MSDFYDIKEPIKLHIGGRVASPDWKILNIVPSDNVDYVGDLLDLSKFPDNCCEEIYASHVLEHVGIYSFNKVLQELRRILIPDGELKISVPDLDTVCELFVDKDLTPENRHFLMLVMFGGQTDKYDFHNIGLNYEILSKFLRKAGFNDIQRVEAFNLFNDCSTLRPFKNRLISLNVVASTKIKNKESSQKSSDLIRLIGG